MSPSRTPLAVPEETVRIRPRRRTRPRRIGPLWVPFWWVGRHTRRIRPWLWRTTLGMGFSSAFTMAGLQLLVGIGDVKAPLVFFQNATILLVCCVAAIILLRLIEVADTPEDWSPPDVRWLRPDIHW